MKSREDRKAKAWLSRPLCRRYAVVHLSEFHVPELDDGAPRNQPWCWAFALFKADEFEVLGVWRADTAALEKIVKDLWDRGVLSIRTISISEGKGNSLLSTPEALVSTSHDAQPRILAFLAPQAASGAAGHTEAGKRVSPTIRSALDTAGRIQSSLVSGARRRAPFASADAASDFVASWLQRADRRLYEAEREARSVVRRAA